MKCVLKDGVVVYSFLLEVEDANCHVYSDPATRKALLFDVGEYNDQLKELVSGEGLKIEGILLTHTHYDHVGGLVDAAAALQAQVFVHHRGRGAVKAPGAKAVRDRDVLSFGGFEIEVLATEGHTPDSCCYLVGRALFTGDTLFNGSVGGTADRDLFLEETGHVRDKILTLPDETAVFPGHGPATTVGIERVCNPFF
jgi:hydroxyacylglutathione hydrolase